MSVSKVSFMNLGLACIGHKAFVQSETESSVEARYGNLFYDVARRATLRAHPWNFAAARAKLAPLDIDVPAPWTYAYALPSGCLKARKIISLDPATKIPFEIGLSPDGSTRVLYTNYANPTLLFTFDVENPLLFDALFTDAFGANMGFRYAPIVAPSKSAEVGNKFAMYMRQAQAADASEGEAKEASGPDWLEARLGRPIEFYLRGEGI